MFGLLVAIFLLSLYYLQYNKHLQQNFSRLIAKPLSSVHSHLQDIGMNVNLAHRSHIRTDPVGIDSMVKQEDILLPTRDEVLSTFKLRSAQKLFKQTAKRGEGDRFIGCKKPKHLFVGKRKKGTANHR